MIRAMNFLKDTGLFKLYDLIKRPDNFANIFGIRENQLQWWN